MRARVLLVVIVEGVAGQGGEEVARFVRRIEQEILAAYRMEYARAGQALVQYALRRAQHVLHGALEVVGIGGAVGHHHARGELGAELGVAVYRSRREAAYGGVVFGIGQTYLHAARAAHRQARYEVVLAPVGQREHGAHYRGQLLGDVIVIAAAVRHVGIGGQAHRRHHNGQPQRRGVALYGGAPLPYGLVVAGAVQQPQRGVRAVRRARGHAYLARGALGQHDVAGHAHAQSFGKEISVNECHVVPPYLAIGSHASTV